jgi:hypothetical protein
MRTGAVAFLQALEDRYDLPEPMKGYYEAWVERRPLPNN